MKFNTSAKNFFVSQFAALLVNISSVQYRYPVLIIHVLPLLQTVGNTADIQVDTHGVAPETERRMPLLLAAHK